MDHKNYKKHSWFLVASLHEDDKILDLSALHQKQNNLEKDRFRFKFYLFKVGNNIPCDSSVFIAIQ